MIHSESSLFICNYPRALTGTFLVSVGKPVGDPADAWSTISAFPVKKKGSRHYRGEFYICRYRSMFNYRPLQHVRICPTRGCT